MKNWDVKSIIVKYSLFDSSTTAKDINGCSTAPARCTLFARTESRSASMTATRTRYVCKTCMLPMGSQLVMWSGYYAWLLAQWTKINKGYLLVMTSHKVIIIVVELLVRDHLKVQGQFYTDPLTLKSIKVIYWS
jgi:hypothetical protein